MKMLCHHIGSIATLEFLAATGLRLMVWPDSGHNNRREAANNSLAREGKEKQGKAQNAGGWAPPCACTVRAALDFLRSPVPLLQNKEWDGAK